MAVYLPPESTWPDYLFRVTSSLTWRRTYATDHSFVSPAQQVSYPQQLDLRVEFPSLIAFNDAAGRHLKATHEIESGQCFYTPFISTTTSFKYALSVAELHFRRGGELITIAVIDTKRVSVKTPVWDADHIAKLMRLSSFKPDFKDEYLIFGRLEASQDSFKSVNYHDLVYRIGSFIPGMLDKEETSRGRFSTYWKDLPKRLKPYTPFEASAAFQIARTLAVGCILIPLMINVLLLEERNHYGAACIDEIANLVCNSPHLQDGDKSASFQLVLTAYRPSDPGNGKPRLTIPIYDFLGPASPLNESSMSTDVRYVHRCLAALRQKLRAFQMAEIREYFNLSVTTLIVRSHTHGRVDTLVKTVDRGNGQEGSDLLRYTPKERMLMLDFRYLLHAVDRCKVSPLMRLNDLIQEYESGAPKNNDSASVDYWSAVFQRITQSLTGSAQPNSDSQIGLPILVGGQKRKIDEVESPAQANGKRVKVESTEMEYTMSLTTTRDY